MESNNRCQFSTINYLLNLVHINFRQNQLNCSSTEIPFLENFRSWKGINPIFGKKDLLEYHYQVFSMHDSRVNTIEKSLSDSQLINSS